MNIVSPAVCCSRLWQSQAVLTPRECTSACVPKRCCGSAGFKYPVTLSGLGQGFSALAAFTTCRVLKWVPAEKRVDAKFFAARMLPVGFFNATTLMFGNAVYLYLTVAFIQMLKAFTPVITMIGLFLASMEVCCLHSRVSCQAHGKPLDRACYTTVRYIAELFFNPTYDVALSPCLLYTSPSPRD